MFTTTKQQFQDDPLSKVNYTDYVPKIEEKKNKKNDSCLNFAHRIDLKILNSMNGTPAPNGQSKEIFQRKRGASTNVAQDIPKDQVFTLGQLNDFEAKTYHIRQNSNTQHPLSSDRLKASSETLIQIEDKFKMTPGKTEGRNDDMKPPKYLAAK